MFPDLRLAFALAFLWLVAGCEINRVLTIRPDGSGQIYERFLASRDSHPPKSEPGLSRPTAEFVVKKAAEFGTGVEVSSFTRIETEDMLGYEATDEFSHVTKVRADTFLQQSDGSDAGKDKEDLADTTRNFQFTKGESSELHVPLQLSKPRKDDINETRDAAKADPEQQRAVLEAMAHTTIRMSIRVEGKIEKTNSHFRKNNEVIVNEENWKGVAADPKYSEEFKKALSGKTTLSDPSTEPLDERYIKNESVDVLTIRFR